MMMILELSSSPDVVSALADHADHSIPSSYRRMNCSGVWSSGTAYVTFEDVVVPKTHLIGQENQGFKYIMYK